MEKQDLTGYGDGELSGMVLNDEGLYTEYMRYVRRGDLRGLKEFVSEIFTFTDDQWQDMSDDFDEEVKEWEK